MARQSFNDHERVDSIDELLPQTQCRRCGYPGCRPYAEAIAKQQADINRCPPGGEATIVQLARLLGRAALPLDPAYGVEQPPAVARVIEDLCIGCTKCIQACPVDAIIGAAKQMHAVIADLCTGCELCLAPCPVDCIEMVPTERPWDRVQAGAARGRFEAREARLAPERLDDGAPQAEPVALRDRALPLDQKATQALIRAAVERTRRIRAARRQ